MYIIFIFKQTVADQAILIENLITFNAETSTLRERYNYQINYFFRYTLYVFQIRYEMLVHKCDFKNTFSSVFNDDFHKITFSGKK